jgi:translation initiation factor 1 (eIF-1/SUI1)
LEENTKNTRKTLSSLSDLGQLLSDAERKQLASAPKSRQHDGKNKTVRVITDSKGRKGKNVTIVEGLQHNPTTI